jgi:CRP-like cAMP-binding protein
MQNNKIELFSNLKESFEDEFYKYSKSLEFKKGTVPFFADDLLKYFFIIVNGRIKTYQYNIQTNKEQTIFIYKYGDMFDVISLLDGKIHEVSYEVLEDSKVLQIPIERVRYWLDNDITFNKIFFPYLASTMRHTEELATDLTLYDTKNRLINLLVDNLNEEKRFKYGLIQNLSNSEIAKILGTVRHVVERTLKQLKADNIIEKSRQTIIIKNFQKILEKTTNMLLK